MTQDIHELLQVIMGSVYQPSQARMQPAYYSESAEPCVMVRRRWQIACPLHENPDLASLVAAIGEDAHGTVTCERIEHSRI